VAEIKQVLQPTVVPDHISKLRPDQEPNPSSLQILDPTKVNQPYSRQMDENQQNEQQSALLMHNFDSNFDSFIRLLKGMPYVSDSMVELLFYKTGNLVTSGLKDNFTEQITKFMQLMKMEPEEVADFVKNQSNSAVQFQGPLFDKLRTVIAQTSGQQYVTQSGGQAIPGGQSAEIRGVIGDFLKQYDAYVSRPHIEENIRSILDRISDYMISKPKQEFTEMVKLYKGIENETMAMSYIKNGIIPFLSNYISRTRDFGQIRNLITMLTFNAAKIENSSEEQLEDSFNRLMSYRVIRGDMTQSEVTALKNSLIANKYTASSNRFVDSFVELIKGGVKGDAGIENRESFKNVMEALVLDKSVYIPLLHFVIPAEVHDKMFFSEIWVDPDADNFFDGKSNQRTVKLLIKFDIKDVGFFESIILNRGDDVAINIYYPDSFTPFESRIRNAIGEIMTRNNLNCTEIGLAKSTVPKDISEVFPKIFEKEKIINVTV
jgi:hypothetical protein